jgi:hypothetical protein
MEHDKFSDLIALGQIKLNARNRGHNRHHMRVADSVISRLVLVQATEDDKQFISWPKNCHTSPLVYHEM